MYINNDSYFTYDLLLMGTYMINSLHRSSLIFSFPKNLVTPSGADSEFDNLGTLPPNFAPRGVYLRSTVS